MTQNDCRTFHEWRKANFAIYIELSSGVTDAVYCACD